MENFIFFAVIKQKVRMKIQQMSTDILLNQAL